MSNKANKEDVEALAEKGVPGGVATLGADGKVPAEQLPPSQDIQDATLTQKGIVQLSDSVTDTSSNKAATPKAVKTAYDRAEQAFTSASEGKAALAGAIGSPATAGDTFAKLVSNIASPKSILAANLTAKGVSGTDSEALMALAQKVANVKTGQMVTGSFSAISVASSSSTSVQRSVDVGFQPSRVIMISHGFGQASGSTVTSRPHLVLMDSAGYGLWLRLESNYIQDATYATTDPKLVFGKIPAPTTSSRQWYLACTSTGFDYGLIAPTSPGSASTPSYIWLQGVYLAIKA